MRDAACKARRTRRPMGSKGLNQVYFWQSCRGSQCLVQ
jgi:hypothetical protein